MTTKALEKKETKNTPERLLRVVEIAEMFSVSKATIWNWTNDNPDFPKPAKLTSKVTVWKLSELERYLNEHIFKRA